MVNNFPIPASLTNVYILWNKFEWFPCQSHVELWPNILLCCLWGDCICLMSPNRVAQLLFRLQTLENSQLSFHWNCKGLCFHWIWSHAAFCGLKLMPCGLRKAKHMPDWWGRGMCHAFPKIPNSNWNIRANICSKAITNCKGFFYSSMYASLKHL